MKRITLPIRRISVRAFFTRSSNSPRYLVPASMAERSMERMFFPISSSGTSPLTIRWASPSATAVLPTPGSPTSTGLFLVRRERMRMHRAISRSRPTTGSSFPSRARALRLRVNCSSALDRGSSSRRGAAIRVGASLGRRWTTLMRWRRAVWSFLGSAPRSSSTRMAMVPFSLRMPSSRCSVPTYPPPVLPDSPTAFSMTRLARGVSPWGGASPASPVPTIWTTAALARSAVTDCSARQRWAAPASSRRRPSSRCSLPT